VTKRVFRESDVKRDDQGQFATQGGVWAKRLPDVGRQRGNQYGRYEWRYSHDVSRDVTTRSARMMGLPYRHDSTGEDGNMLDTTPGQRRRFATSLLKGIDESNRSGKTLGHPVYHGTQQKRFANAKVGDIVKIPLTATTYYQGMARGFTMGNQQDVERLAFDDEARAKAPRGTVRVDQPDHREQRRGPRGPAAELGGTGSTGRRDVQGQVGRQGSERA
jgi:hypothetical protein